VVISDKNHLVEMLQTRPNMLLTTLQPSNNMLVPNQKPPQSNMFRKVESETVIMDANE
jgi:hypothetical protein